MSSQRSLLAQRGEGLGSTVRRTEDHAVVLTPCEEGEIETRVACGCASVVADECLLRLTGVAWTRLSASLDSEAMTVTNVGQRLSTRLEGLDGLRRSALAVTLGFVGVVTLFVGGAAVADPGGWTGIGGTAIVVLGMLGLCLLGLYRPGAALVVLAVAACAPLAFGVWSLVDYGAVHDWEDTHGPLSLVLVAALCAPAAVAGLSRPRAAGYFILTVSVAPLLLAAVGAASDFYEPLLGGLLLAPLIVSGVLFLMSGRQQGQPHPSAPLPSNPVLR